MNEQEQRIAIAEACGYQHIPNAKGLMWNTVANRAVITPGSEVEKARLRMKMPYEAGKETLPDYLHDLNAIHEAEGILLASHQMDFAYHLKELACPITGEDWMAIHATAAQRAEAFLKTIGKWKD